MVKEYIEREAAIEAIMSEPPEALIKEGVQ